MCHIDYLVKLILIDASIIMLRLNTRVIVHVSLSQKYQFKNDTILIFKTHTGNE